MFDSFRKSASIARKETPDNPDRRNFLRNGAAWTGYAVVVAGLVETVHEHPEAFFGTDEQSGTLLPTEVTAETAEVLSGGSEQFENRMSGYAAWWTMSRTTLLFVDSNNVPVGEVVPFQDFVDKKEVTKDGQKVLVDYLYTPVVKNDVGEYAVGNIAPEWSNYVERIHAEKHGIAPEDLTRLNVAEDFERALSQSDEPELQAGIITGEIKTNLDIIHYFGDKPVRGAEHLSRINFLRQSVVFKNSRMSADVQAEVRDLLPAVCGKESKFNDDLKSSEGARGISQFMPATWSGLGMGEYGEFQPLITQVEAMGKHCDNIYNELMSDGVEDLLESCIVPLFPTRAAYERDFLVPCMINAYNPGAGTMRRAVKEFLRMNDPSDILERYKSQVGKDVFFELNQFALESDIGLLASYGPESAAYVPVIYALRAVLQNEVTEESIRVAANG